MIEKVEEVKETHRKRGEVSRLFTVKPGKQSTQLVQSCTYPGARGERKGEIVRSTIMSSWMLLDSRFPRSGGSGITRHWRGGWGVIHAVHARLARSGVHGSVDASTAAWLSASICQFVFMFEEFTEARLGGQDDAQQLGFRRRGHCCAAPCFDTRLRDRAGR